MRRPSLISRRGNSTSSLNSRPLRYEPLEDRRMLAGVMVDNTSDVVDGTVTSISALIATPGADGISIREAILAANADNTDPSDSIDFAPTVTGTIQLTNVGHAGELLINSNLAINGPGAGMLTIRAFAGTAAAGDGTRVFNVTDGNNGIFKDVAISGLTVTGGDPTAAGDGGGILSRENLSLTACRISGNVATNRSGGGVFTTLGSLVVSDSTISGNTAYRGGGVYSGVNTTITGSTISGNASTAIGGNGGGGIVAANAADSPLTVVNSTISGNSANSNGGGILVANPDPNAVVVRHSTITLNRADADSSGGGNGGGIHSNSAAVNIDHAIVAGNLRQASTRSDVSAAVAARFSLIGDNTGATITDNGGNQIGTSAGPISPVLGPLVSNGGPTLTHAFLTGSPAVDAGDPSAAAGVAAVPLADQRGPGFARISDGNGADGARIDIGAFEQQSTQPVAILVVDTLVDDNDGNTSPGDFSLREAMGLASASTDPTTITFAASLTSGGPATILLTMGELSVVSSMTISGPGADLLTIDATGNDPTPMSDNGDGSRVFRVDDGSASTTIDVEIVGLTLTGGDTLQQASGFGGAIRSYENLSVVASKLTGNAGGAVIHALSGDLSVATSTLSGNDFGIATYGGGNVALSDSTIAGNEQSGFLVDQGGNVTISNCVISGSGVTGIVVGGPGSGGNATMAVVNSTISGNARRGISNFSDSSMITIANSTISANEEQGIYNYGAGTISIIGSTISGNGVAGQGILPAVFNTMGGHVILIASTITANLDQGIQSTSQAGTLTEVYSSIIAGNQFDLVGDSFQSHGYNIIGRADTQGQVEFVEPGDQVIDDADPGLAPLADNGGPTKTHALLPGSPAIEAGDPAAVAGAGGVPTFDQRGAGFPRIANGDDVPEARIDIGAYEVQAPSADFDGDGDVDGRDFLAWQRGFGTPAPTAVKSKGDADNDLDVDGADLGVWQLQYGTVPGSVMAEVEEISDLGFMISDVGERETASDTRTVSADSYVEQVDHALEQLAVVPSNVRGFGDLVVWRAKQRQR